MRERRRAFGHELVDLPIGCLEELLWHDTWQQDVSVVGELPSLRVGEHAGRR